MHCAHRRHAANHRTTAGCADGESGDQLLALLMDEHDVDVAAPKQRAEVPRTAQHARARAERHHLVAARPQCGGEFAMGAHDRALHASPFERGRSIGEGARAS